MTETTTPVEETSSSIQPGSLTAKLAACREKSGLNIEQAADEMHLSVNLLRALEQEDFGHLPEPPYVRGYLRGYAKLSGIDPSELIRTYEALRGANPDEIAHHFAPARSLGKISEPSISPGIFKLVGLALLAGILVVIAMIPAVRNWAGNTWSSLSAQTAPPQVVRPAPALQTFAAAQDAEEKAATGAPATTTPATPAPATSGSTTATTPAPATADTTTDANKAADPGNKDDKVAAASNKTTPAAAPTSTTDASKTTSAAPATPASTADASKTAASATPATSTQPAAGATTATTPVTTASTPATTAAAPGTTPAANASQNPADATATTATDQATADATTPAAPAQPINGEVTVKLEFAEEVWMQVKDDKKKVLFESLNSSGTTKEFKASTPLDFKVGNAHGVKVYLNGQLYDQAPHTKGSVSRFKVD